MAESTPMPFDVKLMNIVATLLFASCGLMLLAGGAWWVLRQPFFPLAGLKVDGQISHVNAALLRANVVPQLAGNFFTVDLARTRAAFESVPWVRKAVVRREFPNRLRVTLTEQEPVAYWGDDALSRLINGFGEVFEANVAEVDRPLPRLKGPDDEAGMVLGMYRELGPMFNGYDLSVEQLSLSTRGSWAVELDTGAHIELGRGTAEELQARTRRFLTSVRQVAGHYGRSVESVTSADLRHRDAYALRLRGVSTVGPDDTKKR
ncbi:cell division protein FtsQ/DivIB [Variovorax sp.]|uniref:cell division protein FtsQ/DivIB n=1 Tax=Variovorax sp. TaxID=1871043 RepID=UPI002D4BBE6D|nr:cell division protein FtsQ/DivIB [Variovorax sp.]HYP82202.1 cell division protein FtsQ/DivIB [Variovorax sp.]